MLRDGFPTQHEAPCGALSLADAFERTADLLRGKNTRYDAAALRCAHGRRHGFHLAADAPFLFFAREVAHTRAGRTRSQRGAGEQPVLREDPLLSLLLRSLTLLHHPQLLPLSPLGKQTSSGRPGRDAALGALTTAASGRVRRQLSPPVRPRASTTTLPLASRAVFLSPQSVSQSVLCGALR